METNQTINQSRSIESEWSSWSVNLRSEIVSDLAKEFQEHPVIEHYLDRLRHYHFTTYEHSLRVGKLAVAMALEMELPIEKGQVLGRAAFLHDIGKLAIPREILTKPGRLSDEEFTIIKSHPVEGFRMLKGTALDTEARILLAHHQFKQKDPYPSLKEYPPNPEVLELQEILAVCDMFDALATPREYKPALPEEKVRAILNEDFRGSPQLIERVMRYYPQYQPVEN